MRTGTTDIPKNLWLPKSYEDLESVPEEQIIDKLDSKHPYAKYFRVISPSPGLIIKFRGELSEQVLAQRFSHEKLGAIVPRVLYHPHLLIDSEAPAKGEPRGCWYMAMERCPGVPLSDIVDTMSPAELDHIAEQLKAFLARMETITSPTNTMGSVTGGPYRNAFWPDGLAPEKHFATLEDFIAYYRWMIMLGCTEAWTESVLSQLPKEATIRFAHADLVPKNIIVEGSTITGVVDWALSGFFPDFWEYGRMHDPVEMTPGWDYVLQRVFPGPRREAEINSVRQLLRILFTVF
ncbi:kinase-like protein [Armillaria solidipes]|uniref:Kinase-like protein n=1 Tax=Armillaria solidipes TaxID=1076256 RepID=A0A2H3BSL5_9AGAR|nr:kinase-like protein [Armillaria solidipes]